MNLDKSTLRSQIFCHLDGLVTAPVAISLLDHGVIDDFKREDEFYIEDIAKTHNANDGYLNVALRVLSSQGFLSQRLDVKNNKFYYRSTDRGRVAFDLFYLYRDVVELLIFSGKFHPRKFEQAPFELLKNIFKKYKNSYDLEISEDPMIMSVQKQILNHIEGFIVGPTIVRLGMNGMFHKYFMHTSFRPDEFHEFPESFKEILDFFVFLGWFVCHNDHYQFTDKGLFFSKRATAYGVTVSYLPTFRKIDQLIFENPNTLKKLNENDDEAHVDREMNVWGSGGAHSNYFKIVDQIILDLFNRPIEEQPKGVLDMGCGNGAFLIHIFNLIEKHTLRGQMLDEHPLFLVGVDYNKAALNVTRKNLIKSEIWAKVIWGDIGNPDLLASGLKENYNIDLKDLLNVRTFLDHNRVWSDPSFITKNRHSKSTGSFAFKGKLLATNIVEDNLLEHMKSWMPYVKNFGLILIELHTLDPFITSKHIGKSAATAYDATHGFSDQYIIELEIFHEICKEAGLVIDKKFFKKFPNSELSTISVNFFR